MPEGSFKNSVLTLNPKENSWSLEHLHLAISLQFMYKVNCFKKFFSVPVCQVAKFENIIFFELSFAFVLPVKNQSEGREIGLKDEI